MKRHAAGDAVLPMVLVLIAGLGGCKSADQNVARDQSAAPPAEAPSDTGASGSKTGASAATPRAGMSDSNIVALLDEANKADSSSGAVAAKKAMRSGVKAFAKMMMSEHHALRVEGQQLAKQLKVAPKPP